MILDRIRQKDPDLTLDEHDREAAVVLLVSTVLLIVAFYWSRPSFYFSSGLVGWVSDVASGELAVDVGWGAYVWWGLSSVVIRVLIPLAVIVFWLRARPVEFGFRLRGIATHFPLYIGLFAVMLPILIWVSSFDSFLSYYPFYDRAADGGIRFWLYEIGYAFQFVGVEAFFRGFMTFGLARRFGLLGVVVMTVPYTMIHFGKPVPETFAAVIAGLVLGYLALRSKSFVPGVALHVSVAVTMDLLVLWRTGALGNVF